MTWTTNPEKDKNFFSTKKNFLKNRLSTPKLSSSSETRKWAIHRGRTGWQGSQVDKSSHNTQFYRSKKPLWESRENDQHEKHHKRNEMHPLNFGEKRRSQKIQRTFPPVQDKSSQQEARCKGAKLSQVQGLVGRKPVFETFGISFKTDFTIWSERTRMNQSSGFSGTQSFKLNSSGNFSTTAATDTAMNKT